MVNCTDSTYLERTLQCSFKPKYDKKYTNTSELGVHRADGEEWKEAGRRGSSPGGKVPLGNGIVKLANT
jgi:hypothetical protein